MTLLKNTTSNKTPTTDEVISRSSLYSNQIETEIKTIEAEWNTKLKLIDKLNDHKAESEPHDDEHIFKAYKVTEKHDSTVEHKFLSKQDVNQTDKKSKYETNEFLLGKVFGPDFTNSFPNRETNCLIEYALKRLMSLLSAEVKKYLRNENNEQEIVEEKRKNNELAEKMEKYFDHKVNLIERLQSIDDQQTDTLAKKPVPNFDKLRQEAIEQQLKVKECFYDVKEKVNEQDSDGVGMYFVSPTVDSKSQRSIREKIFFEKFIKNLENLFKFNSFSYAQLSHDIKNHFKNFFSLLKLVKALQDHLK